MDQLVRMVSERAGIDEGAAKTAVDTVLGFLKDKLPDPIAGQLDKAAKGEKVDAGSALGGLFGS
ncbi:MAG: DUF2267 domain-containing protein [Candidatus Limnocylindria bacterium]